MSYEISRKVCSATTGILLTTQIANFITETIPEFSLTYSKLLGTYYQHRFLSFDGTAAGICLNGYSKSSSDTGSLYYSIAGNISSSGGRNIHPSWTTNTYSSYWYYTTPFCYVTQVNSISYINCEVVIAKLESGYTISFGGPGIYIGYYTSPLYGKCIVALNLNAEHMNNYKYVGFGVIGEGNIGSSIALYSSDLTNFSCVFSADGSTYNFCSAVVLSPSENNKDGYTAILSPMYVVARDIWIEPILIPDVFYMTASNYPGLYEEAQVGDVTVFRMTNNGRVVVI